MTLSDFLIAVFSVVEKVINKFFDVLGVPDVESR